MLPLAAFAGLRITRLDEQACSVRLPGGWRTRNPFGSTYFAAQAMAAEMSSGAPAWRCARTRPASVSMLPVGLRASYVKRLTGPGTFTCEDVAAIAGAIARAAASGRAAVARRPLDRPQRRGRGGRGVRGELVVQTPRPGGSGGAAPERPPEGR